MSWRGFSLFYTATFGFIHYAVSMTTFPLPAEGPGVAPEPGSDRPLGAPRRRVLEALVEADGPDRSGSAPSDSPTPRIGLTVATVAARVGGHANTSRYHLDALVDAGLAAAVSGPPAGRGRPALRYRATAAGRRAARSARLAPGAGETGHQELLGALLDTVTGDPRRVREAGHHWGSVVGRRPRDADRSGNDSIREDLAGIMTSQGFTAVLEGADALQLRTCPLVDRAREDPQGVCGLHQSMLQAVLDAWRAPVEATLEPFALPGACRIRIGPAR